MAGKNILIMSVSLNYFSEGGKLQKQKKLKIICEIKTEIDFCDVTLACEDE